MKIIEYHTVGTFLKSYKNAKSIPLRHKYMSAHYLGMVQSLR